MRIALTLQHFDPAVGGAEGFAAAVVRQLGARGHSLHVIAETGVPAPGVDLRIAPLSAAPGLVRDIAPDVTVDWGLHAPADLHRLGGGTHQEFLRYVLEACGPARRLLKRFEFRLSPRHRRTLRRERVLIERPGARFLAVSRFVADQLHRTAAIAPEAVTVLHNGVDTGRFSSGGREACGRQVRERLGLSADNVVFLFVAHNLRLKNVRLLREVFGQLSQSLPQAKLLVIGKRSPPFAGPWLVYAGATSRPEDFYAAADVLLHPTYYDACSNAVIEALACGCPVVSSDRNGSAELIDEGRNGYVLPVCGPPRNVRDAWLATVCRLATNPAERVALSHTAAHIADTHSIESYVARLEPLLESLAAERRRR